MSLTAEHHSSQCSGQTLISKGCTSSIFGRSLITKSSYGYWSDNLLGQIKTGVRSIFEYGPYSCQGMTGSDFIKTILKKQSDGCFPWGNPRKIQAHWIISLECFKTHGRTTWTIRYLPVNTSFQMEQEKPLQLHWWHLIAYEIICQRWNVLPQGKCLDSISGFQTFYV